MPPPVSSTVAAFGYHSAVVTPRRRASAGITSICEMSRRLLLEWWKKSFPRGSPLAASCFRYTRWDWMSLIRATFQISSCRYVRLAGPELRALMHTDAQPCAGAHLCIPHTLCMAQVAERQGGPLDRISGRAIRYFRGRPQSPHTTAFDERELHQRLRLHRPPGVRKSACFGGPPSRQKTVCSMLSW
jgi:hypothetical protein